MDYKQLVYLHLATILPAFAIATYLLARPKGSPQHRLLGRVFMVLMIVTSLISLTIPARIGPTVFGHFGLLHLFSLLTLFTIPAAYVAIRRGNRRAHRNHLVGLYVGGLLAAGAFAFAPGRMLHGWLFGPPAALAVPTTSATR